MPKSSSKSIQVLEKKDNEIRLQISGYPVVLVNALRRLALSDVPTLAVDFLHIYENSSSVFDEILAHRMGLVVLDSSEAIKKLKSPEECINADESDESCFVKLILNVEVDEKEQQGRYVLAGEIAIDSNITRIVYPETPLLYLIPGQRVHAVAYARLGRGKEHSKWSPATVAILRYSTQVNYDGSKASKECLKCLQSYPDLVKKLKSKSKGTIEIPPDTNTSGLLYCAESECSGAIEVVYSEDKLILTIESSGALPPEKIVLESIEALESRAKALLASLKEAKGEGM
ncbi:MAG: DNA-directed RNA polymerase subunit D [Desulfurococcales archaeon]|nr:DNA-directed RNA polymerase subunit D [Desulfurococcales archaeon]MCE4629947.1 DNA-directed RNA polymerase subunit D [Desulfurococcales archaeon]